MYKMGIVLSSEKNINNTESIKKNMKVNSFHSDDQNDNSSGIIFEDFSDMYNNRPKLEYNKTKKYKEINIPGHFVATIIDVYSGIDFSIITEIDGEEIKFLCKLDNLKIPSINIKNVNKELYNILNEENIINDEYNKEFKIINNYIELSKKQLEIFINSTIIIENKGYSNGVLHSEVFIPKKSHIKNNILIETFDNMCNLNYILRNSGFLI